MYEDKKQDLPPGRGRRFIRRVYHSLTVVAVCQVDDIRLLYIACVVTVRRNGGGNDIVIVNFGRVEWGRGRGR